MRTSLVIIVAAVALALTGCGSTINYAAKVNGTVISQSTVDHELALIKKNQAYVDAIEGGGGPKVLGKGKDTFNSDFVAQLVNQRILLTVVHQELVKRKLTVDAAARQGAQAQVEQGFTDQNGQSMLAKFPKDYRDELVTRTAEVNVLRDAVGNVKTDDAAVQQFYDQNKGQFAETCVRAIVTQTKDQATAAKARVTGGEDFGKVADSVNGQGTTNPGGDVGCDTSQFPAEVSQAAASLPINAPSDPLAAGSGFAIIQVTKRDAKPLDDALKAQIRQQLGQQGGTQLQEVVFTDLAKAKVSVNPRIGHFDRGDLAAKKAPSVVPNQAPTTSTTRPVGTQQQNTGQSGQPETPTP